MRIIRPVWAEQVRMDEKGWEYNGCECMSANNCNTYKLQVGVKINANLTEKEL